MRREYCTDTIGGGATPSPTFALDGVPLSWRTWLRAGGALLVRQTRELGVAVWTMLGTWQRRAASRGHLAHLDDRMLRDIGLTRAEAERIARKPFWKA